MGNDNETDRSTGSDALSWLIENQNKQPKTTDPNWCHHSLITQLNISMVCDVSTVVSASYIGHISLVHAWCDINQFWYLRQIYLLLFFLLYNLLYALINDVKMNILVFFLRSKIPLTLKTAGGGWFNPFVKRMPAISHRIILWSQNFLTLSINIPSTR